MPTPPKPPIAISLLVLATALNACSGATSTPALFPARYTNDGNWVILPLPVYSSWEHCSQGAVLFSEGSWEWVGVAPRAAVLNWETGEVTEFSLPNPAAINQYSFSLSPDCQTVAVSENDEIYLIDVTSGGVTEWTNGRQPDYSPDGKKIVFIRDEAVIVKDVGTDVETPIDASVFGLDGSVATITDVTWGSVESWAILTVSYSNREPFGYDLLLVSLDQTSEPQLIAKTAGILLSKAVFSPDGAYVAYMQDVPSTSTEVLRFFDTHKGCRIASVSLSRKDDIFWSADGSRLLATGIGGDPSEFLNPYQYVDSEPGLAACQEP